MCLSIHSVLSLYILSRVSVYIESCQSIQRVLSIVRFPKYSFWNSFSKFFSDVIMLKLFSKLCSKCNDAGVRWFTPRWVNRETRTHRVGIFARGPTTWVLGFTGRQRCRMPKSAATKRDSDHKTPTEYSGTKAFESQAGSRWVWRNWSCEEESLQSKRYACNKAQHPCTRPAYLHCLCLTNVDRHIVGNKPLWSWGTTRLTRHCFESLLV